MAEEKSVPGVTGGPMKLGSLARYKTYRAIRRDEKGNVVEEITLDGEQYARLIASLNPKVSMSCKSEPEPE